MSDLHPTSSDIRCEQSFSGNSTTSPISAPQPMSPTVSVRNIWAVVAYDTHHHSGSRGVQPWWTLHTRAGCDVDTPIYRSNIKYTD